MKKVGILSFLCFIFMISRAQQANWQNMDLEKDGVFGISTDKAYNLILKDKPSKTVIVAVIDSGLDTAHVDLAPVVWTSTTDGSHGRNFIGKEWGKEDVTNLAAYKKDFFDSLSYTLVPEIYRAGYQAYRRIVPEYNGHVENMEGLLDELNASQKCLQSIVEKIGKKNPALEDFKQYHTSEDLEKLVVSLVIKYLPLYQDFNHMKNSELTQVKIKAQAHLDEGLNINVDQPMESGIDVPTDQDITPDPIGIVAHPNYTPYHGTHVAGIIGAVRDNEIGMQGIANNVKIMMLKVVGNVRELRDRSLANAIRYAVDNGARVINLSFGKPYTWDKPSVDEAVQYAMEKDVLLIHAAGNAGEDLDRVAHYPNPKYKNGKGYAKAWMEVGASSWKDDSTLVPSFSNYGKESVDIFAPGDRIYSCIPGSAYDAYSGTSMAAPVVAGVAALIREYYPNLSAIEVKNILMQSVEKVQHNVIIGRKPIPFASICRSGGIVNVYNAIKLASQYQRK